MGWIQPSLAYFKLQMNVTFLYGEWAGTQTSPQGLTNLLSHNRNLKLMWPANFAHQKQLWAWDPSEASLSHAGLWRQGHWANID